MQKIKIGIIGMGRMGITHFSIMNSHQQVEIVSVSDTSKMVLEVLSKYVKGLQVFTDYKEMIDKSSLDGLIIC
ncbi:MAG: Gfo/Idh/MocA family oxidoreductase, partial [Odoribacter sp.]|nr:Gfo/Idh/MocA family oxidoreductase [Odoribacter sp.]